MSNLSIPESIQWDRTGNTWPPTPARTFTKRGEALIEKIEGEIAKQQQALQAALQKEGEIVGRYLDLIERLDFCARRLQTSETEHARVTAVLSQRLKDFRSAFGTGADGSGAEARANDIAITERSLQLIAEQLTLVRTDLAEAWEKLADFVAQHGIDPKYVPAKVVAENDA